MFDYHEPEYLSDVVKFDRSADLHYIIDPDDPTAQFYEPQNAFTDPCDAYEYARELWPDLIDDEMRDV